MYNQYGEVLESITNTSVITDDKSKISNFSKPDLNTMQSDRKTENLTPSVFKCIYSNHNEYGDWTSGYCMTDDNIKRSTYTRELELGCELKYNIVINKKNKSCRLNFSQ